MNDFDFLLVDDAVSKLYQDKIEHEILNIPWQYQKNIATGYSYHPHPTMGFFHSLFNSGQPQSQRFYSLFPLLLEACEKGGVPFTQMLRVQTFMHVPYQPAAKYDGIHLNIPDPHIVGLYYVNDTDGDTVLFDKTTNEIPYGTLTDDHEINEYVRVSPKKGRMLFFNGNRWHSSTSPSKNIRCILTFDFI
jgi:hypothetical protein